MRRTSQIAEGIEWHRLRPSMVNKQLASGVISI